MLVRDGDLSGDDCSTPGDLSALASVVKAKKGGQSTLVKCLPRLDFRMAQANDAISSPRCCCVKASSKP